MAVSQKKEKKAKKSSLKKKRKKEVHLKRLRLTEATAHSRPGRQERRGISTKAVIRVEVSRQMAAMTKEITATRIYGRPSNMRDALASASCVWSPATCTNSFKGAVSAIGW